MPLDPGARLGLMSNIESAQTAGPACWLCGYESRLDDRYGSVSFFRCCGCGFLFAPERSISELHALYTDEYFEGYPGGEDYSADYEQRRCEALSRLTWVSSQVASGRLMEIGAADGTFLNEAHRAGFDVFGVEPAPGIARRAYDLFGLDIVTGFIESVEFPEEPFDVVCAWHVLEHIREPQPAFERLRSQVRNDGWLFLEIPNIESMQAKRAGTNWFHLDPENHVGFYTPEQLSAFLDSAGFALMETVSVSPHSFLQPRVARRPAALAHRAVETVRSRAWQGRPHPYKHELLRAVARPI